MGAAFYGIALWLAMGMQTPPPLAIVTLPIETLHIYGNTIIYQDAPLPGWVKVIPAEKGKDK
jgi:hypothetical protein